MAIKPLPDCSKCSRSPWTRALKGGIAIRPTLAMIGEGPHPEAVIPLTDEAQLFRS